VLSKRSETSEQIAAEADLSFQCSKVSEQGPLRYNNSGHKKTGRARFVLLKHDHCFLSNHNQEEHFLMGVHAMLVFKVK